MPAFKVKRLTPTAKMPEKTHLNDTGYDIFADRVEDKGSQIKVYTGIAIQPPPPYYIEIFPRSSICKKHLQLANSVAIIDYDYRGEIVLVFNKIPDGILDSTYITYPDYANKIEVGEKIAQMVVRWRFDADFVEVNELEDSNRGSGGFGSTGK